ncbi:MAG: hypothetical protein IJI03_19595 [Rudaea sp.]|nr:hypothetical protein [Rudaea sp.]
MGDCVGLGVYRVPSRAHEPRKICLANGTNLPASRLLRRGIAPTPAMPAGASD